MAVETLCNSDRGEGNKRKRKGKRRKGEKKGKVSRVLEVNWVSQLVGITHASVNHTGWEKDLDREQSSQLAPNSVERWSGEGARSEEES